jgi:hypothetical protein
VVGHTVFGAILGLGLFTHMGNSGLIAIAPLALLVASPTVGIVAFLAYGFGRLVAIFAGVAIGYRSLMLWQGLVATSEGITLKWRRIAMLGAALACIVLVFFAEIGNL